MPSWFRLPRAARTTPCRRTRSTRCWRARPWQVATSCASSGGDPLIFGRGGEEAEACRAAGVPVEIVPGISAAIGAAAAAQIPLTHRDNASIVTFVAGQCKGLSEQDWAGLAGKGRTLVIYMGVKTAPQIAEKLMADGLAPEVPVAVVENANRAAMRVLRAPLAGLPALVGREKVKSCPDHHRRCHRAGECRARTIGAGGASMRI